ncbi:helix-turn-helix domain-containing protein [Marinitenerispora sediminis]|uniref:DNA-binding protein n=1 Tax=Marinitenerispora sediminis TaxID=1931232 RepID=A0A368SYQ9_9ACTN|nr:helix-turn-helix domain-containing protein [Marinitenerispora sediminis]RCV47691.1 DNA-binding protein [Marinitenerispora sediminis]RCV47998.1 DNA-binding protein [Marinitenerispora sediminis]RCV49642.1 DNA-binding protein [Marinitenerispora sediminis]
MSDRLYSVEQVAEHLGLHVRTVRNYVRDGRLNAVRIGKQYRIAHEDLEAFTGRPVSAPADHPAGRQRHTEVSSIVEIDAASPETAHRLATLLMSVGANRSSDDQPLRIETAYDRERARMKVIVLGGLGDTARLLEHIEGLLTP